jgi:hypothetical protein
MGLLERAKTIPRSKSKLHQNIDLDELRLVIAFLRGEVDYVQVSVVTGIGENNVHAWAGGRLMRAAKLGYIQIRPEPEAPPHARDVSAAAP